MTQSFNLQFVHKSQVLHVYLHVLQLRRNIASWIIQWIFQSSRERESEWSQVVIFDFPPQPV